MKCSDAQTMVCKLLVVLWLPLVMCQILDAN